MIKKMGAKTIAILLSVAMVFTMMPLTGGHVAYADDVVSVNGGEITVDTTDPAIASALTAFDLSADKVTASGNTLTIDLDKNVSLGSPVKFVMGTAGKKVVLNLNGHSITGRAGVSGTNYDNAIGGNAIEIAANEFDVEINGSGSVIGGEGAVYQNDGGIRQGQWGGNAVFFVNDESNASYAPSKLNHGLKVSGGARLIGGAGSNATFDDWVQNISTGTGDRNFLIEAGRGGDAISQEFTGIGYDTTPNEQTFAKIDVENGTVIGGDGGNVVIGDSHPLTYAYISGLQPVKDMISTSPDYGQGYFNGWFFDRIRFSQGNGGSGIQTAAGRKYISVGQGSTVSGGDGGYIDYGNKGKFVNKVINYWNSNSYSSDLSWYNQGAGGTGISVWGDLGLTNTSPSLNDSNWNTKTENSDDIGVYITGSVKGGNAHSAIAINDYALEGGDAIKIYTGEYSYCKSYGYELWDNEVGILYVGSTGEVTGGNGGDSLDSNERKGSAGDGGAGIFENESSIVPGAAADYYLIEGTVTGGDGGDSGTGSYGFAGNAVKFKKKYQRNKVIAGSGTLKAGDYGSTQYSNKYEGKVDSNNRILNDGNLIFETAVDGLENSDIDYIGSIVDKKENGGCAYVRRDSLNGFKASVVMTPFNGQPTADTTLECNVTRPSGYSGDIYYKWYAHVGGGINKMLDIEGAGLKIQKFNLLSYSDYNSIEMQDSSGRPTYHIKVMTHESLYEHIKYNDSSPVTIWCEAVLDDGRIAESNVLTLTRSSQEGNGDGSGGGDDPGLDPEEANTTALEIINILDRLPNNAEDVTEADADAINAAKALFDTLSDAQKEQYLFGGYIPKMDMLVQALEALQNKTEEQKIQDILSAITNLPDDLNTGITAENYSIYESDILAAAILYDTLSDDGKAQISAEQKQKLDAAVDIINSFVAADVITLLNGLDADSINAENLEEKAKVVTDARIAYDLLNADQKAIVDQDGTAYAKLTAAEAKVQELNQAAADAVAAAIDALPAANALTLNDEAAVNAAVNQYNALTDEQKAKVGNKQKLFDAQARITALKAEQNKPAPSVSPAPAAPAEIMDLPAVKISKPKAAKKKLTAKWKKVNKKNLKKIGGIEIQVAGPGVDKTVTSGKKSKSKKIGGLQSKQKYSVRVRAYKWIGSTKHVSKWSGWKTVKVK